MPRTPVSPDLIADPTEKVERSRERMEVLSNLVPRDLVRRMLTENWDAPIPEEHDAVFFPDLDESELDLFPELSEVDRSQLSEEESEELGEIEDFKDFIRENAGKKLSELPEATPEQKEESINENVEVVARCLSIAWVSQIVHEMRDSSLQRMILDDSFLPAHELSEAEKEHGHTTWLGYIEHMTMMYLEEEQVSELMKAFADALKAEVDKSDDGLEIPQGHFVKKSGQGYYVE